MQGKSIPWISIALVVLICAVVLLVGLPLGAVWLVNNSGCCLAEGPENVITFWSSMIAGFLALFGMVVTGVFIITAFRTDSTARAEAQTVADKAARTFLKRHKESMFKRMETATACVEARSEETIKKILEQQAQTGKAITAAEDETTTEARRAQATIANAIETVESERDGAIPAIKLAREEAEAAAKEVREIADRAKKGPDQPAEGPEQPDE